MAEATEAESSVEGASAAYESMSLDERQSRGDAADRMTVATGLPQDTPCPGTGGGSTDDGALAPRG